MNIRNLLMGLLVLLASGCVTRQVQTLADLPLPADSNGNCCWQAFQKLDIRYGKQVYKLTGALAQTREGVTLVLFDPLGRRLLSINKQGNKLNTYRSPELPQGLPERFLLASSMLVWWPLADWQATLATDPNWQVTNSQVTNSKSERRLLYRGKPIISASYSLASVAVTTGMTNRALMDGPVQLKHQYQDLSITVDTQGLDALEPNRIQQESYK